MRVAIVTGSNKGVGFGIVEKLSRQLDRKVWDVYLTARDTDRGQKSVNELAVKGLAVKFHQLDITDPGSRSRLVDFMRNNYPEGVNIFVNNAGIAYKQASVTIATNFTATMAMYHDILPILAKHARVVNVSSIVGLYSLKKLGPELYDKFTSPMTTEELDVLVEEFIKLAQKSEHQSKGWPDSAYGVSKLALTKATFIEAEKLARDPRKILLNCCCPGYVATDMSSHKGTKTIMEGADTPSYLALLPEDTCEPSGKFVSERKVVPWSKEPLV